MLLLWLKGLWTRLVKWADDNKFLTYRVKKGSWQERRYQYWQQQTNNFDSTRNGCAYFRRANILAPLYWCKNIFFSGPTIRQQRYSVIPFVLMLSIGVVSAWAAWGSWLLIAGYTVGAIYVVAGSFIAAWAAPKVFHKDVWGSKFSIAMFDTNKHGHEFAWAPWVLLFSPVIVAELIVFCTLGVVIMGAIGTLVYLFEPTELNIWDRFVELLNKHPSKLPWLRSWPFVVAGVVAAGLVFSRDLRELILWVVGCILALALLASIAWGMVAGVMAAWNSRVAEAKRQKYAQNGTSHKRDANSTSGIGRWLHWPTNRS